MTHRRHSCSSIRDASKRWETVGYVLDTTVPLYVHRRNRIRYKSRLCRKQNIKYHGYVLASTSYL